MIKFNEKVVPNDVKNDQIEQNDAPKMSNRTKLCAKNVKSADKFEQNGAQKCQIERKIKQNAVPKMSNQTKLCAKNVKSADKF